MTNPRLEKATFGAGCFWGGEEAFRRIKGVVSTRVGYMGGETPSPDYEKVCAGGTGHTEVVEVTFDPAVVSFEDLMHVFWNVHDPSSPAKTQYQSAVFFHSPVQEAAALASKERIDKSDYFQHGILTKIVPVQELYEAEEYHQQFLRKRDTPKHTQKT